MQAATSACPTCAAPSPAATPPAPAGSAYRAATITSSPGSAPYPCFPRGPPFHCYSAWSSSPGAEKTPPDHSGDRAFQPIEPPRRRAARASLFALLGFVGLAALVPLTRAPFASLPRALLIAETLLCPLTGVAAWLVWRRIDVGLDRKRAALRRWGWLLLVSGLWPSLAPAFPDSDVSGACASPLPSPSPPGPSFPSVNFSRTPLC